MATDFEEEKSSTKDEDVNMLVINNSSTVWVPMKSLHSELVSDLYNCLIYSKMGLGLGSVLFIDGSVPETLNSGAVLIPMSLYFYM